jgi:murein DD-endopeptidase MepM/ murein hydrolase activator NlpD
VDRPEPKTSEAVQEEERSPVASEAKAETPQTASVAPVAGPRAERSLRARVLRAALFVCGGAAALIAAALWRFGGRPETADPPPASAALLAASAAGAGAVVEDHAGDSEATSSEEAPQRAPTWRVTQLAADADIAMVDGVLARRPFLTALGAAGLPRSEAQRIARSLEDVRDIDRFGGKDTFTVARSRASGHVVAYEVTSSPTDVWQGREQVLPDDTTKLVARKLDLHSERVRVRKALVVGADLRASLVDAGLTPVDDVLSMLDDALEGHAELSDVRPGARLRLLATEERVEGAFARWASLDAVEYIPAAAGAPPVRVYSFGGEEERSRDRRGWYDARGRQPYHGGWRSPVPLARIASRFNPHRMHPVLHVVMPHNGVDFAAPSGAPVYATAAGVVESVGGGGPCGNMIEIAHPGGIASVYCHLSRFASGLHVGQHVESRQLIGYVGQTGRVTGPHLHFGIKKNGVFIDPMTLRLDGVRVVPRGKRDEFDRLRATLDAELDTIPLPLAGGTAAGGSPGEAVEPADTFYEEP